MAGRHAHLSGYVRWRSPTPRRGETFKFPASDYEAQTAGTFTAHWDANGVIRFDDPVEG